MDFTSLDLGFSYISSIQALILRKWTRKKLCGFMHSAFFTCNFTLVGLHKDPSVLFLCFFIY